MDTLAGYRRGEGAGHLVGYVIEPWVRGCMVARQSYYLSSGTCLPGRWIIFFSWRNSPQWARAFSLPRLHDHTQAPYSVRLLWASHQPAAETSTWQHTTFTRDRHPCHIVFEPTISASEWPQTHTLDCAATGIVRRSLYSLTYISHFRSSLR
jgi:hypothetical protein